MTIKVKVISPEKTIWDTESEQVVLPSISGGLGILSNHAPIVSILQGGLLKRKEQNNWIPLVIYGGVAQVENNEIVVLANGVEEFKKDNSLTLAEAEKELATLSQNMEQSKSDNTTDQANQQIKQLENDIKISKARVEALTLVK